MSPLTDDWQQALCLVFGISADAPLPEGLANRADALLHDVEALGFASPADAQAEDARASAIPVADIPEDGEPDPIHGGIVRGNVRADASLVDAQSDLTCVLMVHEQLLEKHLGVDLDECDMMTLARHHRVWTSGGVIRSGWSLLLSKFGITHHVRFDADFPTLVAEVADNHDVMIDVDGVTFYGDGSYPPGSGHAVLIVGWNECPDTRDLLGFYMTDSNFPAHAIYRTAAQLKATWGGTMISVRDRQPAPSTRAAT